MSDGEALRDEGETRCNFPHATVFFGAWVTSWHRAAAAVCAHEYLPGC
jgi:hypothetical protein